MLTKTTQYVINDGAILPRHLADKAVTPAKFADGTPNTFLAFDAGGRPFYSPSSLADGSVTNAKVAPGTLTLDRFANGTAGHFLRFDPTTGALTSVPSAVAAGTVGTDQLLDGSATTPKLANAAVTEPKLADSSVTTPKLATSAVTGDKLAAASVGTSKLALASVTADILANSAVTAAKYADRSLALIKMAVGTPNKVLGTNGAGEPTWIDPPTGGGGTASSDYFNVKDYGAVGDGTTNDAAAFQDAITAAKAAGGTVFVPAGSYNIAGLAEQNGRLFVLGDGDALLIGGFAWRDDTLPPIADWATPPAPDAPYLMLDGLSFQGTGTGYGLTIEGWLSTKYIQAGDVRNCAFYGRRGMRVRNVITWDIVNAHFHNTEFGAVFEGCTNVNVIQCDFHNIAGIGAWITSAPAGQDARMGGENIRFQNCDWGVCSTGIRADNHNFLTVVNCLLDYCGLPLDLRGSSYASCSNTYFGSSGTHAGQISTLPGYAAPIQQTCVRGVPTQSYGTMPVGAQFTDCIFVEYQSSATPNIVVDGSLGGIIAGTPAQRWSFQACTFWKYSSGSTHNAPTLVDIKSAVEVSLKDNFWFCPNGGAAYANAYQFTGCAGVSVGGNIFYHSRKSSMTVIVASQLENPSGSLRPFQPNGLTDGAVLLPGALSGTPTFNRGIDFSGTAFTSNVAANFGATHWLHWANVQVLGRVGTTTEVRSNGSISLVDGNATRSSAVPAIKIDSAWNGNPCWFFAEGELRQLRAGPEYAPGFRYALLQK